MALHWYFQLWNGLPVPKGSISRAFTQLSSTYCWNIFASILVREIILREHFSCEVYLTRKFPDLRYKCVHMRLYIYMYLHTSPTNVHVMHARPPPLCYISLTFPLTNPPSCPWVTHPLTQCVRQLSLLLLTYSLTSSPTHLPPNWPHPQQSHLYKTL